MPATTTASGPGSTANPANDLSITFDVNSSWLPSGAAGELRELLERLPEGGSYEVDVTGAVGVGDVKNATPEAAEKYNRWMAERRVARVAEWLQSNAAGRSLDMAENYADRDSSRQVYISVKRIR